MSSNSNAEILRKLDHAHEILHTLIERIDIMALELSMLNDALAANTAAVTENTTATDAAVAAIGSGGGGTSAADQAAIDAATATISSNTEATAANTARLTAAIPPAP